jgi:N-acetylglucosamine-6-sulfatase
VLSNIGLFILCGFMLLGCENSAPSNKTLNTAKPNIVVIMTDDATAADMDVMLKTRDIIGKKGITFTNSFVDFPICCPSRASFLTGQAAHNHQVLGNGPLRHGGYQTFKPTQNNSLPVWLQKGGYFTVHMGKYLNGFSAADGIPPGWNLWNGIADDQGSYSYYNYTINENGVPHFYGDSPIDYKTDVQSQKATEFIAAQKNSTQPFFLWLAPQAPHTKTPESADESGVPDPAPRHINALSTMALPMLPSFNEADMSDKPEFMKLLPPLTNANVEEISNLFKRRRESLLAVDDMVERVISSLETAGKLENTYIFFTSDNGWMAGEHRRPGAKYVVYEESIRVPLLIRGPGIPASETRAQLVNNLDMVATIEQLTQISPERIPDGHTLTPLFKHSDTPWRSAILLQGMDQNNFPNVASVFGRYQAVRTQHYKYIEHLSEKGLFEQEFYDLAKDPYELESRPKDPSYLAVVEALQKTLTTLKNCTGESCWITSPQP